MIDRTVFIEKFELSYIFRMETMLCVKLICEARSLFVFLLSRHILTVLFYLKSLSTHMPNWNIFHQISLQPYNLWSEAILPQGTVRCIILDITHVGQTNYRNEYNEKPFDKTI